MNIQEAEETTTQCFRCLEYGHTSNVCMKYKTRLCIYYKTHGLCKDGYNCVFAHGEDEIRDPNTVTCVKWNKSFLDENSPKFKWINNGCGGKGHVFENCPKNECRYCKEKGHLKENCKNFECSFCGEAGHKSSYCTSPYINPQKQISWNLTIGLMNK